jgi:hypothetical protein
MPNVLADWVAQLTAALDLDAGAVDTTLVLDVAREAAHGVARPAAPLTTFLIGLSAGSRGGGPAEVEHAAGHRPAPRCGTRIGRTAAGRRRLAHHHLTSSAPAYRFR